MAVARKGEWLTVGLQDWQFYDFLENIPAGAELLFSNEDVVGNRCSLTFPKEFYAGGVLIDVDIMPSGNLEHKSRFVEPVLGFPIQLLKATNEK